jgi:hypothetical protein
VIYNSLAGIFGHDPGLSEGLAMLGIESALDLQDGNASGGEIRDALLAIMRGLHAAHGIKALSTPFLEKQKDALYPRLLAAGLKQKTLLAAMGLAEEYAAWRDLARTYRGVTKPKWNWDAAVAKAQEIVAREGDLPNVEKCRLNGLSSLTSAVFKAGKTWEDLRIAIGLAASESFSASRNGMRWRSRPEACLSDFLHARGIAHRRGTRYPQDYANQSGRKWATYDLHFQTAGGTWIDVEVWGDELNRLSGGRYRETRKRKERWQAGRANFLGIPYRRCFSDASLTKILEPFIGIIAPFVFDRPSDRAIETSHWSDGGELLEDCRKLAATMPDGIFPSEDWLRKRGKYKNRPGPLYNTMAVRVNQWLGGTRAVRRLLDQDSASTRDWTLEKLKTAWHDFETQYGETPSQYRSNAKRTSYPRDVVALASKIYSATHRLGWLNEVRGERRPRKIIWSREHTLNQWQAFVRAHGRTPSSCMSKSQRQKLPRAVTDEATRIYDAARRLGILEQARALVESPNSPAAK